MWLVIWRVKFSIMENVTGLLGLTLIVFAVALFLLKPDWGDLASQAIPAVPAGGNRRYYWYFAIALFGAAMTPYEVFFFSSGAVEERWKIKDLIQSRINVLVGFPARRVAVRRDRRVRRRRASAGRDRRHLPLPGDPPGGGGGREAGARRRSCWRCGRYVRGSSGDDALQRLHAGAVLRLVLGQVPASPAEAARFHLSMIMCLLVGVAVLATGVDPVLVTEYSVVFSAVALPLTYLPILIVANDPQYMGKHVNSRAVNVVAWSTSW